MKKLVAGLGNVPESRYGGTRHNVGFEVLDRVAARHALSWPRRIDFVAGPNSGTMFEAVWRRSEDVVRLLKPKMLMNLSGIEIAGLLNFHKIDVGNFLVVCDDVNLPLGKLRARARGSEGGHNGLRSIAEHLGTTDYARLRVGVGRGDDRRSLSSHVLSTFGPEEEAVIAEAIERAADAVEIWVSDGLETMMNRFNREPEQPT